MNEADTHAERIDPQLKVAGWGVVEGSRIQREYLMHSGEIRAGSIREKNSSPITSSATNIESSLLWKPKAIP